MTANEAYWLVFGLLMGSHLRWFYYVCKYGDIDRIIKENKELKKKI